MRNLTYCFGRIVFFISKSRLNFFFTIALIIAIYFFISNPTRKFENSLNEVPGQIYNVKSKCSCRKDIKIKKLSNDDYEVNNKYHLKSYIDSDIDTNIKNINKLNNYSDYINNYKHTCNLYNVLRRGPMQRVIGFSVYGSNVNYYKPLLILADAIKKYYPGWSIRVHHNSEIDQSVACDFECKEDIIDFCNVDELPVIVNNVVYQYKASYPHAMMWRWYPIGDDFVDYFNSRDSDSITIQREKDSVDVWLHNKTNTLFHVMRDNPYHNIHILGGMWGYANMRNREKGKKLYQLMLSDHITNSYNPGGSNQKGLDQSFLSDYVWEHAKESATIHDSYNCKYLGGEPFPTQRADDKFCFAACFLPCCDVSLNQTQRMPECPEECRPIDHKDWKYC